MLKTHHKTGELVRYLLKMPKQESSFFYFLMEGQDNLSFYSTLPHQVGDMDREIELFATIEFENDLDRQWSYLEKPLNLEIMLKQIIQDQLK